MIKEFLAVKRRWVVYGLLGVFSCASVSDEISKDKLLSDTIFGTLQNRHFAPKTLNDEFSKAAYADYLKNLDINKRFLLQGDVDKLKGYELDIDDEIKAGDFKLMREAESLLAQRTKEVSGFYEELLSKPFDFTQNESIEFDYDKRSYAKTQAELKEEWRKFMKYQTLIQLVTKMQVGTKGKLTVDSVKVKLTPEAELAARESVKKSTKDFFRRMMQINQADRVSEFMNSVTHLYDPHTDYYAPANKENFDIQISGRLEGIGATLQTKEGFITVSQIVPGSASWRQGQLKPNDQILKVAQEGQDPVDVTDMRLDDAIKLIRGKKGTKVILTVKKTDGTIVNITIERDVVIIEDTIAKSAILETKSKKKIGYIDLPSFYVDFNHPEVPTCSDDVKKELLKLKADGAQGLVFDLRNNGGGSLRDVVKIVGYFIDQGPVVQVKTSNDRVTVLNDNDEGRIFDGPMVVLINPFSASASEIFAAAIQDYQRGLIMGSVHSFGKGTVQEIVDLDRYVPYTYSQLKPLGSVKLTTQKFYRVNGGATQLKGVSSDIVIPDIYKYLKFGEKELENTLPWDQIQQGAFNVETGRDKKYAKAQAGSKARVDKSAYFQAIEKTAQRLKNKQDEQTYTLNIFKYISEVESSSAEDKELKRLGEAMPKLQVRAFANEEAKSDTIAASRRKAFREGLAKDPYVYEAVEVVQDLF